MNKHASILTIIRYLSIGALSVASASYAYPGGDPEALCAMNPTCAQLQIANTKLNTITTNQGILNNNIQSLITNTNTTNQGLNNTQDMLKAEFESEQKQKYYSSNGNWDNALDTAAGKIDDAISGISSQHPPSSFPDLVKLLLGANGADSLQMQLIFKDLLTPPDTQNKKYPDTAFTAMGNSLMRNISPAYQGQLPTGSDASPPALFGDASATVNAYTGGGRPVGMVYSQLAPANSINANMLLPMSKNNQFDTPAKQLLALPFNDTQAASITHVPQAYSTMANALLAQNGVPTGFPSGPNPLVSDALTADFTPLQKKRQVFISNSLFQKSPTLSAQAACFALGGAVVATQPNQNTGNPYKSPTYGVTCEYYPYMAQRDISTTYLSGMGVVPSISPLQLGRLAQSSAENQQIFMNAKSAMRTTQAWRAFAQSNIAHTVLDNVVSPVDQGGDASKSSDQQQSGDPFEARIIGAHGWLKGIDTATPTELLRELVREQAVLIYQNAKARKATQTANMSQSVLIAELATLNQSMTLNGASMALKVANSTKKN